MSQIDMQVYESSTCVGIRTCLTKEEIIDAIDDIPSAEPELNIIRCADCKFTER